MVFFNKRRKFNGQVAALLPAFGLSLDEAGMMKTLEALDIIYPKKVSAYEGAYYIAHLCYAGMLKKDTERAAKLKPRIEEVEREWQKDGLIRDHFVDGYKTKRKLWHTGDFSASS